MATIQLHDLVARFLGSPVAVVTVQIASKIHQIKAQNLSIYIYI